MAHSGLGGGQEGGGFAQPLGPVQGAQCLVQPRPTPEAERPGRGEALQGWAPLPILRTRSASALCLPAALRLTQRPAWGRGGACGHPHSVALLLTSDLGLHRMLPEGPQHRLLGPAPEFPTLWVWMGPGLLRFWQVPSGVCPWPGVRAGEPLTPGAVGVGGCVVRPPPPARRPRSRSHFTDQKHSLQSKFQ